LQTISSSLQPADPRTGDGQTSLTERTLVPERRRLGRHAYTNPHLIAMLRCGISAAGHDLIGPSPADDAVDRVSDELDELGAARGIGAAALISGLIWIAVVFGPALL
jgi:hypothetical protein